MKLDSLISLLRVSQVPGLGPMRIRSLIREVGDPTNILKAPFHTLCRVDGIDIKLAQKIKEYEPTGFAEQQMEKAERSGASVVTLWDDGYPTLLRKIYDPPIFLFVKGMLTERDLDAVAIVGTRLPTSYGKKTANELAEGLAQSGITIVSGFAKGIDTVVHRATLAAGGRTVAVLGNGLDIVYPPENKRILSEFEGNGVFLSEFPFGTQPDAGNFPQRNRIISGLCHATIVVEAGNRSGALLTALNAVDQNREVFAVPGRLTDKRSVGCLRLIRHGAIPVESVDQILDVLKNRLRYPPEPIQRELRLDLDKDEMAIYSVLSGEPKHIDDILEEANLDPSRALSILLNLELKGAISQLSGKHFVRN